MLERDFFQKFAEINQQDFPENPLAGYYRLSGIWDAKPIFSGEISKFNNTLSGIVVANHPSSLDLSLISELIQFAPDKIKKNFKILVSESSYIFYSKYFNKDNFIASTTKPREIVSSFNELSNWVNNDGLLVIFPTKRNNNKECNDLQFETGFSFLLKNIDSTKPVLSLSINPQNILQMEKSTPLFKINVNMLYWILFKNEFKAKNKIGIYINHLLAKDWLRVIDSSLSNQDNNLRLTNKYKEIHQSNL